MVHYMRIQKFKNVWNNHRQAQNQAI